MWESSDRHRAVKDAELALLSGDARHDPARVDRLLHADFVEIGRSGRRMTREQTAAALSAEPSGSEVGREAREVDEWQFTELAAGIVLVTYRLTSASGRSRRSSIWKLGDESPEILFHQATVVP